MSPRPASYCLPPFFLFFFSFPAFPFFLRAQLKGVRQSQANIPKRLSSFFPSLLLFALLSLVSFLDCQGFARQNRRNTFTLRAGSFSFSSSFLFPLFGSLHPFFFFFPLARPSLWGVNKKATNMRLRETKASAATLSFLFFFHL